MRPPDSPEASSSASPPMISGGFVDVLVRYDPSSMLNVSVQVLAESLCVESPV
jgi:hypothetical protein